MMNLNFNKKESIGFIEEPYQERFYFFRFGLKRVEPPLPRPFTFPACTLRGWARIFLFVFLSTKMFLNNRASASGNFAILDTS